MRPCLALPELNHFHTLFLYKDCPGYKAVYEAVYGDSGSVPSTRLLQEGNLVQINKHCSLLHLMSNQGVI